MPRSSVVPPKLPLPTGSSVPATIPRRLAGLALDLVLLAVALLAVAAVFALVFGPAVVIDPLAAPADRLALDDTRRTLEGVVLIGLGAAYFVLPWRRWRATPGQALVGLRVVDVRTGAALPWSGALRRWVGLGGPLWAGPLVAPLAPTVSAAALLGAWLWFLVLLVGTVRHRANRGLHDRVAGSMVVRAAPQTAGEPAPAASA
jgi:uncharacterized RDD family membrane protein YckC